MSSEPKVIWTESLHDPIVSWIREEGISTVLTQSGAIYTSEDEVVWTPKDQNQQKEIYVH